LEEATDLYQKLKGGKDIKKLVYADKFKEAAL
jgi:hypothetical protein